MYHLLIKRSLAATLHLVPFIYRSTIFTRKYILFYQKTTTLINLYYYIFLFYKIFALCKYFMQNSGKFVFLSDNFRVSILHKNTFVTFKNIRAIHQVWHGGSLLNVLQNQSNLKIVPSQTILIYYSTTGHLCRIIQEVWRLGIPLVVIGKEDRFTINAQVPYFIPVLTSQITNYYFYILLFRCFLQNVVLNQKTLCNMFFRKKIFKFF